MQLAQAIALALENSTEEQLGGHEDGLKALAVFFGMVAAEPRKFPVTGRMASKITEARRVAKGPAQPVSRRNARKERQEKRIGFSRRRRAERREFVANFNTAREAYERDMEEMRQIQEADQATLSALLEQETLTPAEFTRALALMGAPPEILETASRVRGAETPKILLP